MTSTAHRTCPCSSGASYDECCAPFHRGAEPGDAVALMRSRYSAFVLGEIDHLVRTLHPDHDSMSEPRAALVASLRTQTKKARYRGLRILDHEDADGEGVHRVLFHVAMSYGGKDASFVELSSFVHDGVGLRYIAGVLYPASTTATRIAALLR